jgi:hypothetical protein
MHNSVNIESPQEPHSKHCQVYDTVGREVLAFSVYVAVTNAPAVLSMCASPPN